MPGIIPQGDYFEGQSLFINVPKCIFFKSVHNFIETCLKSENLNFTKTSLHIHSQTPEGQQALMIPPMDHLSHEAPNRDP